MQREVNWEPNPGPQQMARASKADETFYGGAAGGGKTYLICGLAACDHHRSVIFRKTYGQLTEIRDNLDTILGGGNGKFNSVSGVWSGLPRGAKIELGAVYQEKDLQKWRGRAHDLVAFDEITEFEFNFYQFLTIWNRSTRPGQKVRTICTGNPPTGDEGRWVIGYWAPWLDKDYEKKNPGRVKAQPGELRWFIAKPGDANPNSPELHFQEVDSPEPVEQGGEMMIPRSRTFIPAFLSDNPLLAKTNYKSRLQLLPKNLREAFLEGKFEMEVEEKDHPFQVIPNNWVRAAQLRWMEFIELYGEEDEPVEVKVERFKQRERITALGIDPSRGGGDRTGIAPRYRDWFDYVQMEEGEATEDGIRVAQLVMDKLTRIGTQCPIFVDIVGWGASPYDILRICGMKEVYPINGQEASYLTDRSGILGFYNRRAEGYWLLREALDPQYNPTLMLPPGDELRQDLCATRWFLTKGRGEVGLIQLEDKDEVKKRIRRSPDMGEAVIYAFSSLPAAQVENLGERLSGMQGLE